jgi:nitroimidazol reductase NimA-like FMN-containing flavoprotein (pyridoxamine 5'-phosphate oxidase superfamily)
VITRNDDVTELTSEECWNRLRRAEIGRLATGAGSGLDIFPVTFQADGRSLYFRTSKGLKLALLSTNSWAVFEIDGFSMTEAWSVVARGTAHHLRTKAELDVADSLAIVPWAPGAKPDLVRLDVEEVTGREFVRADTASV